MPRREANAVQENLDAIQAEQFDALAGVAVPDHYRGVTVHADEVDMFAGIPSAEKDPRKSLHVDEIATPELGPGESIFEPLPTFGFLRRYGRISPLTARHDLPYHVVGSDLAGVVLRTGPGVNAW